MNTVIKICGVCDPTLGEQAIQLGAKYIGIMCYKRSKRYVDADTGRDIAAAVRSVGGTPVAVFVDHDAMAMQWLCNKMNIDTVQLHGDLSRQSHHDLPAQYQRIYVINVDQSGQIDSPEQYDISQLDAERDMLLYDGQQAGSGQGFDLGQFTQPYPLPFMLAGGLTASNVAHAIRRVHPAGVDVSSGVESSMAVKDITLIQDFIEAVRGVDDEG